MHAHKRVEPDSMPEFAEKRLVCARDKHQNHDFQPNQGQQPPAFGAEDGVSDAENLRLLVQSEKDGETEDEEEPKVRSVAAISRCEMADKVKNGM
jgi:hypothetical protein